MLSTALAYQNQSLQQVSRTFALTIPQLPVALRDVIGNAYLLCRIADTIEDDVTLDSESKTQFSEQFIQVVSGQADAHDFAAQLAPKLGHTTLPAERDLIAHSADVIQLTHSYNANQQKALLDCVRTMSRGMAEFQRQVSLDGLPDLESLNHYCYYVAGVVGEMLTALFCEYSPEMAAKQSAMQRLDVSFGQGLQMTNILKDIWADRERGACWLPQSVFKAHGFDLHDLTTNHYHTEFDAGLAELIKLARTHLYDALEYILLIPAHEKGIRRFCLWAVGMALLTLRKIDHRRRLHQGFYQGNDVKISRRQVKITVAVANLFTGQDWALKLLFRALV
jgi:farnesyl-diphosphate farnesyltransferase